ncbi:MAG: capping complex subunit for YIEGIA [Oscillospiraceae bacterium]|jgi:hypothetical protein
MEIILYITDCPNRVITGQPLALHMPNDAERQNFLDMLAETLEASVIQTKNGDHIVVRRSK